MTEDEMVGWHHWLNGHEFVQTPEDSGGQRSLMCCSPWGHKEYCFEQQKQQSAAVVSPEPAFFFFLVHCVSSSPTRDGTQSRE